LIILNVQNDAVRSQTVLGLMSGIKITTVSSFSMKNTMVTDHKKKNALSMKMLFLLEERMVKSITLQKSGVPCLIKVSEVI